ncbi:MAG: NAD-binding protein [Acidimicrobiales bacterium]
MPRCTPGSSRCCGLRRRTGAGGRHRRRFGGQAGPQLRRLRIQTALAEVMTMGIKGGVDPLELFKAIRQGAIGRRRTFDGLVDQFLPGEYEPAAFALRLAHKDVSLACGLGRELGVPMRLANLTLEEMTEALGRGWAQQDSRSTMKLQQERAGLDIKVDRAAIKDALRADRT